MAMFDGTPGNDHYFGTGRPATCKGSSRSRKRANSRGPSGHAAMRAFNTANPHIRTNSRI